MPLKGTPTVIAVEGFDDDGIASDFVNGFFEFVEIVNDRPPRNGDAGIVENALGAFFIAGASR